MSRGAASQAWDCEHPNHRNCLTRGEPFECGMPGQRKRYRIDSPAALESALADVVAAHPGMNDVAAAVSMGVCLAPLLDAFSAEAWTLHNALKSGAPWPWPGGYYGQPAIYARAAAVIDRELAVIQSEDAQRGQAGKV